MRFLHYFFCCSCFHFGTGFHYLTPLLLDRNLLDISIFDLMCFGLFIYILLWTVKAKNLEENIEMMRRDIVHPTEVEVELKKRLDQLTDRLIQKQMQVFSPPMFLLFWNGYIYCIIVIFVHLQVSNIFHHSWISLWES